MRDDIKYLKLLVEKNDRLARGTHVQLARTYHQGMRDLAQELIRMLCPHPEIPTSDRLAEAVRPKGICDTCGARYV